MTFLEYIKNVVANFSWIWILEIVVMALVFYWAWAFFKKKNAVWLAYFAFGAVVLVFAASLLGFRSAKIYILLLMVCLVTFPAILFATDIKRALFRMSWKKSWSSKSMTEELTHEDITKTVENIARACQNMSKNDVGSLIVISNKPLESVVESGTPLMSLLTSELIETIFYPRSPLHDGAIVVAANKIVAAGCYLPLTSRIDLPKEFGTRHRAAIGISESNPSVTAIVVSEESGIISAMHDGKIIRYLDGEMLIKIVSHALNPGGYNADEIALWGE